MLHCRGEQSAAAIEAAVVSESEVLQALDGVSTKLTQAALTSLIDQVENKGQSPDYLASVFLSTS